jgi:hypothetical protein
MSDEPDDDIGGRARGALTDAPPPEQIADLARACVDYVKRALDVELDFSAETLPMLDHYLMTQRSDLIDRPELLELIARSTGAYFGEVVRRRVPSFWRLPSANVRDWTLCARPVFLWFNPMGAAYEAIAASDDHAGPSSVLHVAPEYRAAVDQRLQNLPSVTEDEYYTLATRLEVIEIAVDELRLQLERAGYQELEFDEGDYEVELRVN